MKNKLNNDLFGHCKIAEVKRKNKLEIGLTKYDKNSFEERLSRLKYVLKAFPKGIWIGGEPEFVYTFSETKDCFIAGHFIATIVLAQACIEKVVHHFFVNKGLEKEAKKGLAFMIKYSYENKLVHSYILEKIDELRLKRNPWTHLKDNDYPQKLSKRIFEHQIQPHEIIENDAREALQIMFFIISNKF